MFLKSRANRHRLTQHIYALPFTTSLAFAHTSVTIRSMYTPPAYSRREWSNRQHFIRLIKDICAAQHITVSWSSDYWIASLTVNDTVRFIYGYTFAINDAASAGILRDKAAASTLLERAGVPAVPHFLWAPGAKGTPRSALRDILARTGLPLVVKPNSGESGGIAVVRCDTEQAVMFTLNDLAARYRHLTISPFVPDAREFRVVMLAGEPLLVFEKIRAAGEWRHNLGLGATPRVVTDANASKSLAALAHRAMAATGAQLAAVDIVATPDGYKIMELNGGIALASFAKHSKQYEDLARGSYEKILMFRTLI